MSREWDDRQAGLRPIRPDGLDVGNEVSLCSIVQHETLKFRQLSEQLKDSIAFIDFKGLEQVHKSNDVVFFDSLCDLASPTEAYIRYIDYIKHPGLTYKWDGPNNRHIKVSRADEMCRAFLTGYSAARCNTTGNIVYVPKFDGGEYSPYSKAVSNRSSANRLASQLCKLPEASDIKDLNLIGIDLTFPKEVSRQYTEHPENVEKMAQKAIKRFMKQLIEQYNWVREDGQKLGYFFNVHLWHSHKGYGTPEISTPDEPHLHVHLNVVSLIVGKNKEKRSFIRINPILDRDIVMECWSNSIFRACGHYEKSPVFYLHFMPLSSRAQVAHRIRYCGRSPLNDLYNYYQDNDFSEDIPKKFNEFLVDYANRRHPCGFIRNIVELVGDIEGDTVCHICASPAEHLAPLSVDEMNERVKSEGIPIAVYQSRTGRIAIMRKEQENRIKVTEKDLNNTKSRIKELIKQCGAV